MKLLSTDTHSIESILSQVREQRSRAGNASLREAVQSILREVREKGDRALFDLTQKFDGVRLPSLRISRNELEEAWRTADPRLLRALKTARANIERFHRATIKKKEKRIETMPGVRVWREFRPIESVGLYVPGGKAAYPSTVLMLAIPARVAGCRNIVLCTPADRTGRCSPAVLAAARLCGISQVFKIGGAQAIAAMAYGTQTVPKVSKIFGPGNAYVTQAKMLVFGEVAIDMPAGPSEVLILADESARPRWVAADLLSQLEHGEDSQAVLVTFSEGFARKVLTEIARQSPERKRRHIIRESLRKSFAIVAASLDEACRITNEYAPEHLEVVVRNEQAALRRIQNAGSIFLGTYTNEPLGDYATGANHTLATSGYAKMFSSLSTGSFGKMIQVQKVTRSGIGRLRDTVETLAQSEGLDAHHFAVTVRFE